MRREWSPSVAARNTNSGPFTIRMAFLCGNKEYRGTLILSDLLRHDSHRLGAFAVLISGILGI